VALLRIRPISLRDANNFFATDGRTSTLRTGKFSVGSFVNGEIVGAVVVDRPKRRVYDDGLTLEITRVASSRGVSPAAHLVAAATRAAFAMGTRRMLMRANCGGDGKFLTAAGWSRVEDACGVPNAECDRPGVVHLWERINRDAYWVDMFEAA
jgi:hypothetical protein